MILFLASVAILLAAGVTFALCYVGALVGGDVSVLTTLLAVAGMSSGCVLGIGLVFVLRGSYPYFEFGELFSWERWIVRTAWLVGMLITAVWIPCPI